MPPRPSASSRPDQAEPHAQPIARIALVKRREKRAELRFDNAFPVDISSEVFGDTPAIARNISAGGMFVELPEPLPLGSEVKVRFSTPDSDAEIVVRGEIKGHYFLNYAAKNRDPRSLVGMGVRFSAFEQDGRETLGLSLTRMSMRTTH
jgi:hypothetical protein